MPLESPSAGLQHHQAGRLAEADRGQGPAVGAMSEQDCFRRLQGLIHGNAVSLTVDADFLDHIDSPVAVEADSNIWAYGLVAAAGTLFWYGGALYGLGAALAGTVLYFTLGRAYVRRRLRRRVEREALTDLEKWRKLWRFGGVALSAAAAGPVCAAPEGNWIDFVRRQAAHPRSGP